MDTQHRGHRRQLTYGKRQRKPARHIHIRTGSPSPVVMHGTSEVQVTTIRAPRLRPDELRQRAGADEVRVDVR
ncbi:MAG: DNA-directed RNA polymerase I subunit RPA34, partial [Actinomycetota bacterium]|nr:DNA-directed RNA polymerase I subunit RPA34 [Actinomycetota bacterium]